MAAALDQLTQFAGLIGNIADELCLIWFGEYKFGRCPIKLQANANINQNFADSLIDFYCRAAMAVNFLNKCQASPRAQPQPLTLNPFPPWETLAMATRVLVNATAPTSCDLDATLRSFLLPSLPYPFRLMLTNNDVSIIIVLGFRFY